MRVRVLLFARPREFAGSEAVEVEMDSGAVYGDLKTQLACKFPEIAPLIVVSRVSAAGEFVDEGDPIGEGLEIALIPPVSGG